MVNRFGSLAAGLLQLVLVLATCYGIYTQYSLFNLEQEYKEVSVRPIVMSSDLRYNSEFGISNIGVGAAEIMSVSYESDSMQRIETDVVSSMLDNDTVERIRSDMKINALKNLLNIKSNDISLNYIYDFIKPGVFLLKDRSFTFAGLNIVDFVSGLKNKNKEKEIDDIQPLITRQLRSNASTFRVEVCYCSITRRECKHIVLGSRGRDLLSCKRWEGSKI